MSLFPIPRFCERDTWKRKVLTISCVALLL